LIVASPYAARKGVSRIKRRSGPQRGSVCPLLLSTIGIPFYTALHIWLLPAGLPVLLLLGTLPPLMLLGAALWRTPSRCEVRARFDTLHYADLLLLALVLSTIMPAFAALLLIVLMHKTLSAILPHPVHALVSILARIARSIPLAASTLIQLLLAGQMLAPRPFWSLTPITPPYVPSVVTCCRVPRAPPIQ
jgi:hypothetical protein